MSSDPHDKRLRTSILAEEGDTAIVIDTGPDFRQQMLRVKSDKVDAIIYTMNTGIILQDWMTSVRTILFSRSPWIFLQRKELSGH